MSENRMFCFQCEQRAGCNACTGCAGVCGKKASTAALQDRLTGEMIGLSRAARSSGKGDAATWKTLMRGLFMTVTNVNFDDDDVTKQIEKTREEKNRLDPSAESYDMARLWSADEDIRSLKSLILFGLRGMAAYGWHALMLGYSDDDVSRFFAEGLVAVGSSMDADSLLSVVMKTGQINLKCMALLDRANTSVYGTPTPAEVTMKVEKGPFIVVTGHDLKDLQCLLEQTKGTGINVYTHGEMLPAHGYPQLRQYAHLKGNFGTAWQNQQKEFDALPAPILYTSNCLMPPRKSYADRVFTTEMVGFPGAVHIGADKDFSPVIKKALELGGYAEDRVFTGINGGNHVTTGYGHGAVLSAADKIVAAVKKGQIRHFFLVGGCDGVRSTRSYYTDFVKQAPADTVILTLACGKYRFNDLDLGTVAGLPRLMDMGQCNDAYGAVQVALALAAAFKCGVNDLPLTLVLSWYEQKAVCILLTLLSLGIKNIWLGPTLPSFLSKNVLDLLVKNYGISAVTTPEADLKKMLGDRS
ncbi:MAG: hydroxylamine reductase [Pyramidobacter sp.]|jgi:hydroxylamine reductase